MVFAGDVLDMNMGSGNDNYNDSNGNDMGKG